VNRLRSVLRSESLTGASSWHPVRPPNGEDEDAPVRFLQTSQVDDGDPMQPHGEKGLALAEVVTGPGSDEPVRERLRDGPRARCEVPL
jgi:hypothetical protein